MADRYTELKIEAARHRRRQARESVFLAYALGLVFALGAGYGVYHALFGDPAHRADYAVLALGGVIALFTTPRALRRDARNQQRRW